MAQTRQDKAQTTRRALLDAALSVIGSKGYSAASVEAIVEAAGVSKGTAYVHFKSKAALAQAILEESLLGLIESFTAQAESSEDAARTLQHMIRSFASLIFNNPEFGHFLLSEIWREGREWSGRMRELELEILSLLESQIVRGQCEGIIREDINPRFEAVALVGMVLTSALYYLGEQESTKSQKQEVFIERVSDFVRHASMAREFS